MSHASNISINYHDLWLDASDNNQVLLSFKILEKIEHELNLIQDPVEQIAALYESIDKYINSENPIEHLQAHTKIFLRLVLSGMDLMGHRKVNINLLYIGALIDMNIKRRWCESSFYQLISKTLRKVICECFQLNDIMKQKIKREYQRYSQSDYNIYFN